MKDGNAEKAALEAGYAESTASKKAHLWVGKSRGIHFKPELARYIQELRTELVKSPAVADAEERHLWWSSIMRDENEPMPYRMKASELLAKAQGDFTENIRLETEVKHTSVLDEDHKRALAAAMLEMVKAGEG